MMFSKKNLYYFSILQFVWICSLSYATTLVVPPTGDVVGEIQYALSEINETLDEVGRRFDVGLYEMARANPHVDMRDLVPAHAQLVIPSQYILPHVPREGIVINLAEYRLYYFPRNENVVLTFPVGIGRKGWNTPLGTTKIVAKEVNPKWRPTESLRAEAEKYGDFLPDEVPSSPYNPLGKHSLRLGWPTFLIHGTNRNDGIGVRVSAGCIRMFPDDIEQLFHLVPVGTPVRVINEPVKVGKQDGALVVQIHPFLKEQRSLPLPSLLEKKLHEYTTAPRNNKIIRKELIKPSGLVRKI